MKAYQKNEEQINEELERFIEFGAVLDKSTRKYFVAYLKQLLGLNQHIDELNSSYFNYFKNALTPLFSQSNLFSVIQKNQVLSLQVVSDIVGWFAKTYKKIAVGNPYANELSHLQGWSARPTKNAYTQWPFLVKDVESNYTFEEFNGDFYRTKLKHLTALPLVEASAEQLQQVNFVITDILSAWDALLQAKLLNYQLKHLEQEAHTFAENLNQKANDYEKLTQILNPFLDYIGRYWDVTKQPLKNTTFNVIEAYHQLLKNHKELEELAAILGKMRAAEIETDEETFELVEIKQETILDPNQKTEIKEVKTGNHLSQVLPSEIALLSIPETESIFLKKYAENNLLIQGYEDEINIKSSNVLYHTEQKTKLKQKGPFIICVDTSGSMEGKPEQIAKVLCFAIMKMASKENRRAFLINFSSGIKTLDLLNIGESLDALADFLLYSFQGGTDISLALHHAIDQLKREEFKNADVLVISDFIMYKIDSEIAQQMQYTQHHLNTQYHSITLNNLGNHEVLSHFDNHWVYDPNEQKVIKSVYKNLIGLNT